MEKSYNIKYKKPMDKKAFYEYLRLEDEKEKGGFEEYLQVKVQHKVNRYNMFKFLRR